MPEARNARERDVAVASTSSVRPSCSSFPAWPTTAIPKQVTTTAVTDTTALSSVSRNAPAPPIRSSISRIPAESNASKLGAIAPNTRPITATAHVQPHQHRRVQAQAEGDDVGQPGRAGGRPGPRLGDARTEVAAPTQQLGGRDEQARSARSRAAAPTSGCRRTARSWVFQPNGESQLEPDGVRRVPDRPQDEQAADGRDATAAQVRALAETWQATAVSPVATSAVPAQEAPKASEPFAGRPPSDVHQGDQQAQQQRDGRSPKTTAAVSGAPAGDRRAADQLRLSVLLVRRGCGGGPRTAS